MSLLERVPGPLGTGSHVQRLSRGRRGVGTLRGLGYGDASHESGEVLGGVRFGKTCAVVALGLKVFYLVLRCSAFRINSLDMLGVVVGVVFNLF